MKVALTKYPPLKGKLRGRQGAAPLDDGDDTLPTLDNPRVALYANHGSFSAKKTVQEPSKSDHLRERQAAVNR